MPILLRKNRNEIKIFIYIYIYMMLIIDMIEKNVFFFFCKPKKSIRMIDLILISILFTSIKFTKTLFIVISFVDR